MIIKKLIFIFCLPAFIWNAPLCSSASNIPSTCREASSLSIWDLLSYENLSYDNIMAFIEGVEYGDIVSQLDTCQMTDMLNFIAFLASNGIPEWNTQAREELEQDIEWLFSDDDEDLQDGESWWWFSNFDDSSYSIVPAVYTYSNKDPEIILCKSWFKKKWKKTKKFIKKHKKKIIVAAVIVVAVVVIVATQGAAAPVVAPVAAAAGGADSPHINKAGDVRFQDEEPEALDFSRQSEHNSEPSSILPAEEPLSIVVGKNESHFDEDNTKEMIYQQANMIKETISEQVPDEALNILPEEESSFWNEARDGAKEQGSELAHRTLNTLSDVTRTIGALGGVVGSYIDEYHQDRIQESL